MPISSTNRKAGPFPGDGVQDTFPFEFKVFSDADLLVVRADSNGAEYTLVLTADYTVTLNPDQGVDPGGEVVLVTPLPSLESVVVTSDVANLQPVDITNQGGFYPAVMNTALDRLTILCQQIAEQVSRSIKVTLTSDLTPDEFVTELQQGASEASASAAAAAASAALASTFVPAGYAQLAGADFTGPVSTTSTLGVTGLLSASGGVEVPADATGNNARRANQLIWNVGGAARLPQWATAGRPATPTQGDTGENTDLDCIEHYNGTEWVQLQRQASAVVATTSGTSHAITGIPAYATRVELHLDGCSTNGTQNMLVQAGTSAGLVVAGYAESAAYDIFVGGFTGAITAGFPVPLNAAATTMRGTVTLFRKTGTNRWECQGLTSRVAGGLCWTTGYIDLPGALDRIALSRAGADAFDAGAIWATWS